MPTANFPLAPLCCTDQQPGAASPPQRHLWEANVLRPPEFEHAVQRRDGNGTITDEWLFGADSVDELKI